MASPLRIYSVLWIDIVGYSLLSDSAAVVAVQHLEESLQACPAYQAAKKNGLKLALPTGDGFGLLFDDDPRRPVNVALELRRRLRDAGRIQVRMGLHVGTAQIRAGKLVARDDASGTGPNIAARIMGLAEPGEVLMSDQIADMVGHDEALSPLIGRAEHERVKHGKEVTVHTLLERPKSQKPPTWLGKLFTSWADKVHEKASRGTEPIAEPRVIATRLRQLARDAVLGILLACLAVTVDSHMDETRFGHDVKQWAYEKLQANLIPRTKELPVVVDVTGIIKDDVGTTDLQKLHDILDAVEAQGPASVALDIDFGYLPLAKRWLDEDDLVVSQAYDYTMKGKPVYLAVKRMIYRQDPEQWLGDEKFAKLVCHPFFSNAEVGLGPTTLATYVQLGQTRLPSVFQALVTGAKMDQRPRPYPAWLAPLVTDYALPESSQVVLSYHSGRPDEKTVELASEALQRRIFLNFSALNEIKARTIHAKDSTDISSNPDSAARLGGAMVLIGSTDPQWDSWTRPDTRATEAGVYLHAVGAYSEAVAPLAEFKPRAKVALSVLSFAFVLFSVLAIRYRYIAHVPAVQGGALSIVLTAFVVLFTIALGTWLVRAYSVFWTDFVLSSAMILFHPRFEHWIEHGFHHVRAALDAGWGMVVGKRAR